jgi:hypothetical protein
MTAATIEALFADGEWRTTDEVVLRREGEECVRAAQVAFPGVPSGRRTGSFAVSSSLPSNHG